MWGGKRAAALPGLAGHVLLNALLRGKISRPFLRVVSPLLPPRPEVMPFPISKAVIFRFFQRLCTFYGGIFSP